VQKIFFTQLTVTTKFAATENALTIK
jgi:hypothetical protein